MKPSSATEPDDLKAGRRHDLREVKRQLETAQHLSKFLDATWFAGVNKQIDQMQGDLRFDDARYELLRIFTDESVLDRLERGLAIIEPLARQAGKTKTFRNTALALPNELMSQLHQIDSAIFEIMVLSGLIRAAGDNKLNIDIYPKMGNLSTNVEARIKIADRWCYTEATALSRRLSYGDEMIKTIDHVLAKKTADGRQLALVNRDEPAVLLLALKGDVDRRYPREIIENFLISKGTPLSAILIFGSAFCRMPPELITNPNVRCPVIAKEAEFFQGLYAHML